jgi:hypothetical protein
MPQQDRGKLILGLVVSLGGATAVWAHEPYMDCFDNNDRTVTCEAGYEDGSPAGDEDKIFVKDDQGKTLMTGTFTDGNYTFERPAGRFVAVFVGGDIGHVRRIPDSELMQR